MVFVKKILFLAMSMGICMAGAMVASDQGSAWNRFTGWVGSYFTPQPRLEKQFVYRGRTPQDIAYQDLIGKYGCNSSDSEALCNIQIPEIELSKSKGPAYEGFVSKRSSAQKPEAYNVKIHKEEPTLRSYLRELVVPRYWAGSGKTGKNSAINDIRRMKDRPELEKMMDESVPDNYDSLVHGVQERMEKRVLTKALSDVKRNESNLHKALDAADDQLGYAQEALKECSLKHTRSPELCGGQELYLSEIDKRRNRLYQKLEPERQALSDSERKINLRKNELKNQRFARTRAAKQLEEERKWADFLYRQEIGE